MYSVLAIISQKIIPVDDVEIVDLTSPDTAFDNIGYEDAPEDEPITEQPKHRKININIPQNCTKIEPVSSNSLLARIFQNSSIRIDEIASYLALPKVHPDECPLMWWKTNRTRFPILSKVARKYLAIPATSTPSERLFSEAGNIMTIKRTQLSSTTLENLVFCKKNWRL